MQRMKQPQVTGTCVSDHGLDQVIAWNNGCIDLCQLGLRRSRCLPTGMPICKIGMGAQMRMQAPHGQCPKTQREICSKIGHHF